MSPSIESGRAPKMHDVKANKGPCDLWRLYVRPMRRQLVCFFVPIVLAILPLFVQTKEIRCLYVVLVMGIFWTTELLPLPVTALIPLVAYPVLGVLKAADVSMEYLPDSNFIFMGSLMMAIAVEITNLHERCALRILLFTGTSPRWLMLGFQLATTLISMWITNTATTAMMLPILMRVLIELDRCHRLKLNKSASAVTTTTLLPSAQLMAMTPSYGDNTTPTTLVTALSQPSRPFFRDAVGGGGSDEDDDTASLSPPPYAPPHPPSLNVTFFEPTPSVEDVDCRSRLDNAGVEAAGGNNIDADLPSMMSFSSSSTIMLSMETVDPEQLRIYKGLLLCVCYSASIGGTGTLVGTAPNLVMVDAMNRMFPNNSPLNFTNWMLFAVPVMLVMLLFCWLWLQLYFIGFKKTDKVAERAVHRILRKKYDSLGRIGYAEGTVMVCFLVQVCVWITRHPGFMTGWSGLFESGYVTDGTAAMLVALMLFILPAKNPFDEASYLKLSRKAASSSQSESEKAAMSGGSDGSDAPGSGEMVRVNQLDTILTWQHIKDHFPWGTIMLLGGSFAMAKGVKKSGLSVRFGDELMAVESLPEWLFIGMAVILATALTEFSSNVATASIFIPILTSIARIKNQNPMMYVFPIVISSSFAFMFPAGTPPNAIVFSSGLLKVTDMIVAGSMLNLFGLLMNVGIVYSGYSSLVFDMSQMPSDWNATTTSTVAMMTS